MPIKPIIEEMREAAARAAVSNRGMYPPTASSRTYWSDGTSVEDEPYPPYDRGPKLNKKAVTLYPASGAKTFQLEVIDAPVGAEIAYESLNTKVVTVSETGLLTRKAAGEGDVKVTVGDLILNCHVTGSAAVALVDGTEYANAASADAVLAAIAKDVPIIVVGTSFTGPLPNPEAKVKIDSCYGTVGKASAAPATAEAVYKTTQTAISDTVVEWGSEFDCEPDIKFTNTSGVVTYKKVGAGIFNTSGTVELLHDVTHTAGFSVDTGVFGGDITLKLNGFTLAVTPEAHSTDTVIAVICNKRVRLNIVGPGSINGNEDLYAVSASREGYYVNIDGKVNFFGGATAIYAEKSPITVNDAGDVSASPSSTVTEDPYRYTCNCLDASYKSGIANITIKGGRYYKFNPADNQAEGPGTNFLAEGYKSVADGDWFVVSQDT